MAITNPIIRRIFSRGLDAKIRQELKKNKRINNNQNNHHPQPVQRQRTSYAGKLVSLALLAAAAYGGHYLYKNDYFSKIKNYFFQSNTLESKIKEPNYTNKQEPEKLIDFRKLGQVKGKYKFLVSDSSIENPFIISSELVEIIKDHTKNCRNDEEKAKAIYDWIEENIDYGDKKRTNGYKNSEEVLEQREGVCGEMAYVYVTMARCCGLKSNYVSVKYDFKGDRVAHACAAVEINGSYVLVDPAYHKFDVQHKEVEILTDKEVLEKFQLWRAN